MRRTTYAIIEDERPAVRLLAAVVARLRPEYELVFQAGDVEKAVDWFEHNAHPDLIFLDIMLSDELSFEFLRRAQPSSSVIFTTAYNEYAVKAFDFNSIHYLLKPIEESQLEAALLKFEQQAAPRPDNDVLQNLIVALSDKPNYRRRYLISQPHRFLSISVDDVAYFYSENKATKLVTASGDVHTLDFTLQKVEQEVDPDLFFRISRKFLVHINAIKKIEPYFGGRIVISVYPPLDEPVVVSEERVGKFKLWLGK